MSFFSTCLFRDSLLVRLWPLPESKRDPEWLLTCPHEGGLSFSIPFQSILVFLATLRHFCSRSNRVSVRAKDDERGSTPCFSLVLMPTASFSVKHGRWTTRSSLSQVKICYDRQQRYKLLCQDIFLTRIRFDD